MPANAIVFHNALDIAEIVRQLQDEGENTPICGDDPPADGFSRAA
ncbi:hypothetical protein [Streptomyces sp. NPDC054783]